MIKPDQTTGDGSVIGINTHDMRNMVIALPLREHRAVRIFLKQAGIYPSDTGFDIGGVVFCTPQVDKPLKQKNQRLGTKNSIATISFFLRLHSRLFYMLAMRTTVLK